MDKLRKFLIILCSVLLFYVILVAMRSGFSNTLMLFSGVFLALSVYTVFFETLRKWRWLNYLIVASVVVYVGVGAFALIYGQQDSATFEEDIAIVLGAGLRDGQPSASLRNRLEAAVDYHFQNPNALIVVSGGVGRHEAVSEAEVMAAFLEARGVPADLIIREGNSHSTYENMRLSWDLVDSNSSIVVITNDFHIFRGTRFAAMVGFEQVTSFHASTPIYAITGSLIREVAAIFKMWVLGN